MSLQGRGNSDPGQLDRRVTLQEGLITRDAVGGSIRTLINVVTVWAAKRWLSGGRFFAAEAKHYQADLIYRIRHRVDVVPGWQLVAGDDAFEVVATEEIGRRQFLDLTLRAIDQTVGDGLNVLLLEGSSGASFLELEDGTPLLLETAA